MFDELITLNFNDYDEIAGGAIEYTDLTDIDTAVANMFGRHIHRMVVVDGTRKENKEFDGFQKRDITQKFHIGQFDDPFSFLKKLLSKTPDDATANPNKNRSTMLPCCYLYRDLSVGFCDGSDYVDIPDFAELKNEKGDVYAIVSKSFMKINYTISSMAWNKPTASRLGIGLAMYLRKNKRDRPHVLKAKSMIAGAPVVLNIEINEPQMVAGDPIDVTFNENRAFGNTFMFEVIAEVLEAREVTPAPKTVKIGIERGGVIRD
ncbi:TPA: hypothetical protein ACX6QP_002188 [Photobacterium damselae]